jgi:beta-glucosidase
MEQLPPMMDYDIRHGRTYMYFKGEPLYPFGYGLSYTTFAYSNLRTSSDSLRANGSVAVSVSVKNTGSRAGDEVVQLYVSHVGSAVERPTKELKGFERVALRPGETKTVTMTLDADELAYWDAARKAFVVEEDSVKVMVGGSSADLKLNRTVRVTK